MEVNKSVWQKIVSFRMKRIIEEYKNNKQDRNEYIAKIKNISILLVPL